MTEDVTTTETEDTPPEAVEVAEETMVGDLMEAVLQELRNTPKSWPEMSEEEQGHAIDRTESRIRDAVRKAVGMLVARDTQHVMALVESVTFKDGAKAVLKAPGFGDGIHQLADNINAQVMVVLLNDADLVDQPHDHKPDPDQADLLGDAEGLDKAA